MHILSLHIDNTHEYTYSYTFYSWPLQQQLTISTSLERDIPFGTPEEDEEARPTRGGVVSVVSILPPFSAMTVSSRGPPRFYLFNVVSAGSSPGGGLLEGVFPLILFERHFEG